MDSNWKNHSTYHKLIDMKQTAFAYLEAKGKSKVWMAYAEHFANEEILEEEFDHNSGYVYLYLNGVAIGSMLGGDVEYLVYDEDRDCEKIFKSIEELNEYRK